MSVVSKPPMLRNCCTRLPLLFTFLGLCLVAWVGYCSFAPMPPPSPALEVAYTDLEISGCIAGEKRGVVLHVNNRSREPMRILGLAGS